MFAVYSNVPAGYDLDFLSQTTGIPIIGRSELPDGNIQIAYRTALYSNNFEIMTEAIETYAVDYLSVAMPKKLSEISVIRNEKIKAFKFNGIWIELDLETKANIVGVVSGLDRNPGVAGIDWSLGAGQVIFLDRATLYALADAAFLYIQGCFTRAKDLVEAAKAAVDINELAGIDILTGWPQDD